MAAVCTDVVRGRGDFTVERCDLSDGSRREGM